MRSGRQRYWCKDCHSKFETTRKSIRKRRIDAEWDQYVFAKQTLREISEENGKTILSIKNAFEEIIPPTKIHNPRPIHLVVDSSFFGKKINEQWGVVVFRDATEKENLWWKYINKEKIPHYNEGYRSLLKKGYKILSVTCDGFSGLVPLFSEIPVQFCHFHQKQIIRRYVTLNPRLIAGIELKELVEMLGKIHKTDFELYLKAYTSHYSEFLNEKSFDPVKNTWSYTHRKLRSAIRSLNTNLPYLFTYEKYPALKIPTTTNTLESHFSHIKDVVRVHRGLKREMKEKFIETILLNSSIVKNINNTKIQRNRDPKL